MEAVCSFAIFVMISLQMHGAIELIQNSLKKKNKLLEQ